MIRKSVSLWVLTVAGLLLCSPARAGLPEKFAQVAQSPTDPNVMVVRYTEGGEGLIFTRDGGKTWRITCIGTLLELSSLGALSLAMVADGTLLIPTSEGIWQDDSQGCGWVKQGPLGDSRTNDMPLRSSSVVLHPSDNRIAFAATDDLTEGAMNGILRRDEKGVWSDFGSKDKVAITDLRVVTRGDRLRFVESALQGVKRLNGAVVSDFVLRISDDDGATWTTHPIDVNEGSVRLQAIDPSNLDRIVITVERPNVNALVLVSSDGGATFREYLRLRSFGGIAFAPDGRVWIGDGGGDSVTMGEPGLYAAKSLAEAPVKMPDNTAVRCVHYQPASDDLLICRLFSFGKLDPRTQSFTQLVHFRTVHGFVECPGVDLPATCKAQLCRDYCGPARFAAAPFCAAYREPQCGPAADGEPVASPGGAPGSDAGSEGSAGSRGVPSAGQSGEVSAGGRGVPSAAGVGGNARGPVVPSAGGSAPAASAPIPKGRSGCAAAGEIRASQQLASLSGVAFVLLLLQARRRPLRAC